MTIKIGINGFGRIGRNVFRLANAQSDIQINHINDLTSNETLAHLLKYDSVHGTFPSNVRSDDSGIYVDDKKTSVSSIKNPAEIDWASKDVDIVFECTGVFRNREGANLHLKSGAKKVLISAPASGEDATIVMGVNDNILKKEDVIISNGSCTTNCLAPVAKVIHDNFGIESGLMTTVHAYTNDQRILDLPHKDLRRARAAAQNMIPTSTGAAKAIALVIPELKGKLHGMAIRVPTANVSLVDLTVQTAKKTTTEEVNTLLKNAAAGGLKGVLGFSDAPLVSTDYNGNTNSSTVDGLSTAVMNGNHIKVISWYDNETGFSNRMLDLARKTNTLT